MVRKSEDGPRTGWVYLGKVDCMLINLLHILLLHLWFHSTEAQVPPVSTVKALMMFTVIDNLRACIPLLDLSVLNELKVSPKGLRFNLCRLARSSVLIQKNNNGKEEVSYCLSCLMNSNLGCQVVDHYKMLIFFYLYYGEIWLMHAHNSQVVVLFQKAFGTWHNLYLFYFNPRNTFAYISKSTAKRVPTRSPFFSYI